MSGAYRPFRSARLHPGAITDFVVLLSKTVCAEDYARYVYGILNGDNSTVKNYDYVTKAAHTNAKHVGLRLRGTVKETVSLRVGTAWGHVFDGDAKSQINCGTAIALDAPSLVGDTGILEVGTTLMPSAESPWPFDVGVKGYVGDRRSVTGSATVLYRF